MELIKRTALRTVCAGVLVATMLPAYAADLDYTYAETRYLRVDLDGGRDGDGISVGGWYRINEQFFAMGNAAFVDVDGGVDVTALALGGGYIHPLSVNWDGLAIVSFRHSKVDAGANDSSDSGFGIQLGVRGQPARKIETRFLVNYVNLDDSDLSFTATGDYYFNQRISAGVALDFGDDADSISVGARFYFGNVDK